MGILIIAKKIFSWEESKFLKVTILILFLILLVFTRFYNLDRTARFIWDESSDLVNIHKIVAERKLTLIGPISEDGNKVFSSLTYYMLLPFAILGKFDPISTAFGAAFWGIITAFLILVLAKKINIKLLPLVIILVLIWFPLLETSRWAWNPNFIPFWTILGIIFYLHKPKWSQFLSGVALGLTIHHHYLSIFAVSIFVFIAALEKTRKHKIFTLFPFILGVVFTILPFILFDLLHPPGLFLSRILYFNQIQSIHTPEMIFSTILENFQTFMFYLTQNIFFAISLGIIVLFLLLWDIKNKNNSLLYGAVWISQVVFLAIISPFFTHYLLPAFGFFLTWLIWPRKRLENLLSKSCLCLLIIASSFSVIPQLKASSWQSDIRTTRAITDIIRHTIRSKNLQNVNLAVLSSPDTNTYGRRYRDLLLIKDIEMKDKHEYFTADYLFVVTTSSEKVVREDPAAEMTNFRNGLLFGNWSVLDSPWKVYLFGRNTI